MSDDVPAWRIGVDTGGTFTDAIGVDPSGRVRRAKVLSSGALRGSVVGRKGPSTILVREQWGACAGLVDGFRFRVLGQEETGARVIGYATGVLRLDLPVVCDPGDAFEVVSDEEAPILAARLLTRTPSGATLPTMELRLATTRGTNALLTRRGGRVAFFVTRGFGDLLEIGAQQRPDLFALDVVKPDMLHERVVEVDERIGADGAVLRDLDVDTLRKKAVAVLKEGIDCAGVALLHSDRYPAHEVAVAALLRDLGFAHVTCSHEVAPFIKVLPRAQTAVVDALLSPVIGAYLGRVGAAIGASRGSRVLALTSAGGLVEGAAYRAKDSLLSGPAGGVVGARAAAARSGFARAISFDMGGTSTDVARLDDGAGLVFEHRVGDALLVAPAVGVETVAAGGGSVCDFDGVRLGVGPASAGASPGPACYGAGGPLTLTDVNLLLGRLDASRLPIPIDRAEAQRAVEAVRGRMASLLGSAPEREALLEGFLRIAAERMTGAVRRVSARQGYDPRAYALVAFGGAGGQHACAVAELLGIGAVVVPRDAGVLSAAGLLAAPIERHAERQVLRPLAELGGELPGMIADLRTRAAESVAGVSSGAAPRVRVVAALRLIGQESTLELDVDDVARLGEAFAARYRDVYGHAPERGGRGVELVWLRAIASVACDASPTADPNPGPTGPPAARSTWTGWFGGQWREVVRAERNALHAGEVIAGPAMIFEDHGAIVVEPGWSARVDDAGALLLERSGRSAQAATADLDEVALEVHTSRLESIAREMGEALRRTAVSTNVKERLDYSCAILDHHAELIVNAPHVPVHLGSLGLCVRMVREVIEMSPGDVVVTNHPALGGSHLPDVTVITPIHDAVGVLLGYAASRAHHAEIGSTRPGSMPPGAVSLVEEGVVIPPMHLVRSGAGRYDDVAAVLQGAMYPSRAVADNLADMRAAAAANQRAVTALREMAARAGAAAVGEVFERIKQRGEAAARRALGAIAPGVYSAEESLDDGAPIRVRIEIGDGAASISFAGSAPLHRGNLNATPAIIRSAVIYVLRLLVTDPMPLNEGLMRAVTLEIPEGMLNPRFDADLSRCPAVAGGNVETSQRVVDTLLKALGVAACSQGTMNNVIFGTEVSGGGSIRPPTPLPPPEGRGGLNYYETVCGGCGATPNAAGASAVHSHMTNTRITDPEILETRFPVRLEMFEVRRNSGGQGRHRGGDGVVRAITFLTPMSLSVLTQHRVAGPYGMDGGEPGAPGRQRLVRADGTVRVLGSIDGCEVDAGETLILETPGGGGFGALEA